MSVLTIIKEVKELHPERVALVKIGKFYNVYMKDAYIIGYLFGYKLRDMEKGIKSAGFPEVSLKRVLATLENKKIEYMILDRRNNYDVDEKYEIGNINKYNEIYNKAKKIANLQARIENIYQYLNNNINRKDISNILKKMEQTIYE